MNSLFFLKAIDNSLNKNTESKIAGKVVSNYLSRVYHEVFAVS